MKEIIIGDVHTKIDRVQSIIEDNQDADRFIFLGDYFDDFNDTLNKNITAAKFISEHINDPKFIFLWGNHEVHYAKNSIGNGFSGYTKSKHREILPIMNHCWNKLKFYHESQGYIFSHAGLHPEIFCNPVTKELDRNRLERLDENAYSSVMLFDLTHPFLQVGISRGGDNNVGGLLWCDFNQDFEPIENVNQIFGHTRGHLIRKYYVDNSKNYCADTNLNSYLIIQNETVFVVDLE